MNCWNRATQAIGCVAGIIIVAALVGAGPTSAQLPDDPVDTCPVLAGEIAPDAEVLTADGDATTLHAVMGDSPAIVVFYRGVW